MAEIISENLHELKKAGLKRNAVFNVGYAHNDGVASLLEKQGFTVASIKSQPTHFPDLDGKVFRNFKPTEKKGADWVVACYDKNKFAGSDFDDQFQISECQPAEKSVSPKEIDAGRRRFGPRSK